MLLSKVASESKMSTLESLIPKISVSNLSGLLSPVGERIHNSTTRNFNKTGIKNNFVYNNNRSSEKF